MLITPEDLLFQAVKAGDLQKVRTLLKEVEGSSLNVRDESVCAPIHYAACLETTEVLEALIEAGADLNRRDEHEWTALHYAAFDGRLQAVRRLITHGADTLARNDFNKTCVEYATERGHRDIVEYVRPLQYARQNNWSHRNAGNFPTELQDQANAFLSLREHHAGIGALPPELIEVIMGHVVSEQYPRPRARRRSASSPRATIRTCGGD